MMNTLIFIPVSLLLSLYLSCIGSYFYLVVVAVFDALLLITNVKLLASSTKGNAWLAFKFSSPYPAVVFLVAIAAAVL